MAPDQPPLPTAWNLPFQPESGIQTSILISESDVGFKVAATRQKAGRFLYGGGPCKFAAPAGGVNSPAGIGCAIVIVVSGSFSAVRLSHEAAAVGAGMAAARSSSTANSESPIFIRSPSPWLGPAL
jgi:hypothetical protein